MGETKKLDGTVNSQQIVVRRNKPYLFAKRVLDYIGSGIGIILFSPILLIIAIVIKVEDGGPIIFKQERIGHNGRHFNIW